MKLSRILPVLSLFLAVSAIAQTLTGTVTNGTTNKPATGTEVSLLDISQGMNEVGTTKTDSKGSFSFKLQNSGTPHLVRATHQGATYFKMVPPGSTSADLQVYDAARKVDGLSYTVDVIKLQTQGDKLNITRLFAVNNQSSPPKTQASDSTLEFSVPEGTVIETSMAKAPNGQPVNAPVTKTGKGGYSFSFPLRPGETQLQVGYSIPYSGSVTLDPKSPYALQHVVVMLPKSMKFEPQNPAAFQSMQDPNMSAATVEVAQQTQPGQSLAFKISGSGTLPAEGEGGATSAGQAQSPGSGMSGRPGGGLGAPIDAPDPLSSFKWYILGGFVLIMAGGAYFISQRNRVAATGEASVPVAVPQPGAAPRAPQAQNRGSQPASSGSTLLQALKEELFELELERQQGRVSKEEYEKHKAALDQTLARALQRQNKS